MIHFWLKGNFFIHVEGREGERGAAESVPEANPCGGAAVEGGGGRDWEEEVSEPCAGGARSSPPRRGPDVSRRGAEPRSRRRRAPLRPRPRPRGRRRRRRHGVRLLPQRRRGRGEQENAKERVSIVPRGGAVGGAAAVQASLRVRGVRAGYRGLSCLQQPQESQCPREHASLIFYNSKEISGVFRANKKRSLQREVFY